MLVPLLVIKEDWVFVVVVAVELLEPEEVEGEEGTNGSCEYTLIGMPWKPIKSSINITAKLTTDKLKNAGWLLLDLGKLLITSS